MDDRWKPLSKTGGPVTPFAKTMTVEELLAAAPSSPVGSRTGRGRGGEDVSWEKGPDPDASGAVLHTVSKSDTLMGIALRYGISVAELRLANDIPSGTENLAATPILRIPAAPSKRIAEAGGAKRESQAALSRRLRVTHSLSDAEALYYLTEADWDYGAAEAALKTDLAFENSAAGQAGLAAALHPESTAAPSQRAVRPTRAAPREAGDAGGFLGLRGLAGVLGLPGALGGGSGGASRAGRGYEGHTTAAQANISDAAPLVEREVRGDDACESSLVLSLRQPVYAPCRHLEWQDEHRAFGAISRTQRQPEGISAAVAAGTLPLRSLPWSLRVESEDPRCDADSE